MAQTKTKPKAKPISKSKTRTASSKVYVGSGKKSTKAKTSIFGKFNKWVVLSATVVIVGVAGTAALLLSHADAVVANGMIAYTGSDGHTVYVVNPDASGKRVFLQDNGAGYSAWSPSGNSYLNDGALGLTSWNYFGAGKHAVTGNTRVDITCGTSTFQYGDQGDATYSPSGDAIAYSTDEPVVNDAKECVGKGKIYIVNSDGSNKRELAISGVRPSWRLGLNWSPDGTSLYYVGSPDNTITNRQLYRVPATGGNSVPVGLNFGYTRFAKLSRDGNRVAYEKSGNIMVSNLDGTNQQQVYSRTSNAGALLSVDWSADGTKLLVNDDLTNNYYTAAIYIVNSSSSTAAPLQIGTGYGASWQPGTHSQSETWYGVLPSAAYGEKNDIPVPGKYYVKNKTERAVFRPSTGMWYIGGRPAIQYGQAGDIPRPADYNNDGLVDIAVYRPVNSTLYIRNQRNIKLAGDADENFALGKDKTKVTGIISSFESNDQSRNWLSTSMSSSATNTSYSNLGTYGNMTDIPVPADYNGDGLTDLAVYRPSNNTWYISGVGNFVYGSANDIPVPADYNGDGKTDIAMFRPSTGTWYVRGVATTVYGQAGDIPLPGDYNGDGKLDLSVMRP